MNKQDLKQPESYQNQQSKIPKRHRKSSHNKKKHIFFKSKQKFVNANKVNETIAIKSYEINISL